MTASRKRACLTHDHEPLTHGRSSRREVRPNITHAFAVSIIAELIAQGHRVSFCLIPTDWRSALKEFGKYGAAVTNICSIGLCSVFC